jgi:glutathione synthase/RimK-type ligase-like ATP-grasp enzyme
MTIALATCKKLPHLDVDDQRLHQALRQANIPTEIAIWDDVVDWSKYELCIIRSTWDYVPRYDEYIAWTEQVAAQTTLWNPAPLIRWNSTKAYLQELQIQGIPIVPTRWLEAGNPGDFTGLMAENGWTEIVVKPLISAGGNDTFRINPETLKTYQTELDNLLAERDLMAQPFMPTVQSTGELSFLFFNNEFSHAVQKLPSADEFRVHEHRGGMIRSYDSPKEYIDFAFQCLKQAPWPTLYARVDILLDEDGRPLLTELELTEPSMFLAYDPASPHRFAQAIQKQLSLLAR